MNIHQRCKIEGANWLWAKVAPNVYAVATLKQAVSTTSNGCKTWVKGDRHKYDAVTARFLNRLSIAVYGKVAVRRFGKQLPVATSLEGDGSSMRHHLNFMIHRPEWMSFPEFERIFRSEWSRNDWAMPDLFIEERTDDCVGYSLKDGFEALLEKSTRF